MVSIYIPGIGGVPSDYTNFVKAISKKISNVDDGVEIIDFEKIILEENHTDLKSVLKEIHLVREKNKKIDYLVAHSMGGAIAIAYAMQYPKDIKHLILIDPLVDEVHNYAKKILDRIADAQRIKNDYSLSKKIKIICTKYIHRLPLLYRENNIIRHLKILRDKRYFVQVPTTFLWAEQDRTCPVSDFDLIKNNFSKYKLVKIPKRGHDWISDEKLLVKYFNHLL